MPVNPGKLKAMVDVHSGGPGMAAIANPQMAAPPDADLDDDFDDDGEEEEAQPTGDPVARGNELLDSWGEMGEAMKDAKGEIVDGAHEVGPSLLLAKIPEETVDEVYDAFDKMPEDIQHALAKYVATLPENDVAALAAAIIADNDGDTDEPDQKLVTVYLQQLAMHAKEEVDPEDIADEDEEEDGDEEKADGEEGGDKTDAAAGDQAAPGDAY